MMKRNPPVRMPAAPINYPTLPKPSKPSNNSKTTGKRPRKKKMKEKAAADTAAKLQQDEKNLAATHKTILDTLSNDASNFSSSSPLKTTSSPSLTAAETLSTLSTLIKQTLEEWSHEISKDTSAPSDSNHHRDYFLKMSNLHLMDEHYSNAHGFTSLSSEFSDFKITKPKAILDVENTLSAQTTSMNQSSAEMTKCIKGLRSAIRNYTKGGSKVELEGLLDSTKSMLLRAAELRKVGRRSSDIIREGMKKGISCLEKNVLKRGKEEDDEESEVEEEEEEEKHLAQEEELSPMVSPRHLILTAKRESRMERRKTRASIREAHKQLELDIKEGRRSAEAPAAKRRIVPFHLQQDNLKNVSWFTNMCGKISSSTVLRSVSTIGDLQREIVLERSKKKENTKKGEYKNMRRKSIALVQEVHVTSAHQAKLVEEKKGLQKELNISIKRYTVANKLLGEGEKVFKEKEKVWNSQLEEIQSSSKNIQRIMTENNEVMKGMYEKKMEILETSLVREKERLEKLISSVKGSAEKMSKVKEELIRERDRRKVAEADSERISDELATAKTAMGDTKRRLEAATMEAENSKAIQGELASLKEEVKVKSEEYLDSVEEVQRLKGEVERLRGEGGGREEKEEGKRRGDNSFHREASAKFIENVIREASPTR
ncbi:hypothetical protein TL16_g01452 [Triparma laevis f. inornata]|uniref:Uncharacterized protein n=1 Tax=Triparma laevis f. inornata TaxID=1714386 RepID=A0A9W6ZP05_9STRA|nr:hypothetical protein TL16_g01452 [Triparma laevis f. inornata]